MKRRPIAASAGFGRQADLVTAFSMDLNGNGITVSNDIWEKMKPNVPMEGGKPVHPIKADALKPVVEEYKTNGNNRDNDEHYVLSRHKPESCTAVSIMAKIKYAVNNNMPTPSSDVLLNEPFRQLIDCKTGNGHSKKRQDRLKCM